MAEILVVDSDLGDAEFYRDSLAAAGAGMTLLHRGQEALDLLARPGSRLTIVIVLWELEGSPSGPELLSLLRRRHPDLPVLVVNGQADLARLARAKAMGAAAAALKPLTSDKLRRLLASATSDLDDSAILAGLQQRAIGQSREFIEALRRVSRLVPLPSETILLSGENGTGKEVLARAIHDLGPGKAKPWVPVNIASLSETLLESELFGHEAGAFTGATHSRQGCFERAAGGTIFLDEIGELRTDLQAKLLRVIQERMFVRVGGNAEQPWEARLICATNRDLLQDVQSGRFRVDLYYRIASHECCLPPLRSRGDDIDLLANRFLAALPRPRLISDDARRLLRQYCFPGNVRELAGVLSQAAAQCAGDTIEINDLPLEAMCQRIAGHDSRDATTQWPQRLFALPHREALNEIERLFNRSYLPRKLLEADGIQRRAAELAELDPKTFRTKFAAAQAGTSIALDS